VHNVYFCDVMKKIPGILVRDYALTGLAFFVFFTLMRPFGFRNSAGDTLWMLQSFGCCSIIFFFLIFTEIIVTYMFRLPCDYSRDWPYQIKTRMAFYPLLIVMMAGVVGEYFTIIEHGWKNWMYFWMDADGGFTLKWYMNNFAQDIVWCIFLAIYWYYKTKSRMKEYKIQQLLAINDEIDKTETTVVEKLDAVNITGESKESLLVSPSDIIYIESVANYLSIKYLQDGELKQKRIRNTLKNVEETLAGYPFLLHCHRAFLVNTRFITHVEGNAAGCQLHLFSIDHTIPVSKANIDAIRQAL